MSFALIQKVNDEQKKAQVVDVRSGDTVRVFLDGAEYAVLDRPFFINLNAGKGKHRVRAVCANEEQTVFFTVE